MDQAITTILLISQRYRKQSFNARVRPGEEKTFSNQLEQLLSQQLQKKIYRLPRRPLHELLTDQDNVIVLGNLFHSFFDIDQSKVAGFLQADIKFKDRRHLVFATPEQLLILGRADYWYVDATFKVVKQPFRQLWIIHAFISSGSKYKQVPLLYVLMSGRRKSDYAVVLQKLNELAGVSPLEIVADFEASVWTACRSVYPNVRMKGCAFHHCQAIYGKVAELGLGVRYQNDTGTKLVCRKLMGLIFLPSVCVMEQYEVLANSFATDPALTALFDYYAKTWLSHSIWSINDVNVYDRPIRTNNDAEGYHRRLNSKADRNSLQFYVLVRLLQDESKLVIITTELLSKGQVYRYQRKESQTTQSDGIIKLWKTYKEGTIDATQLLKDISFCVHQFH